MVGELGSFDFGFASDQVLDDPYVRRADERAERVTRLPEEPVIGDEVASPEEISGMLDRPDPFRLSHPAEQVRIADPFDDDGGPRLQFL